MADSTPETWRPVVGYEGLYEVSDHGRVRRVGTSPYAKPGRVLRPGLAGKGYQVVMLYSPGKHRLWYVHVLVAQAFIGPVPDAHEVNHRDGNRANNRLSNLEYVTHPGNMQHALETGLWPMGERHHNAKLTATQVAEIRRLYRPRAYSTHRLAREFEVSAQTIHNIITGRHYR